MPQTCFTMSFHAGLICRTWYRTAPNWHDEQNCLTMWKFCRSYHMWSLFSGFPWIANCGLAYKIIAGPLCYLAAIQTPPLQCSTSLKHVCWPWESFNRGQPSLMIFTKTCTPPSVLSSSKCGLRRWSTLREGPGIILAVKSCIGGGFAHHMYVELQSPNWVLQCPFPIIFL